ncbi:hypothetical protein Gotri_011596 [Gossypium trilobum]|uniref:Myb/SANT-like domain-containing protein n=1 Tax=Gossypium trilobum TaxID=34281 RepID=A0A7J9EUS0_9ROSI|nr:hypothetical protein [Gossypium trilobum]
MLKAKPNFELRIRRLKRDWAIIYDMLTGKDNSDFSWDEYRQLVVAKDVVWNSRGRREQPLRTPIESAASLGPKQDNEQNKVNNKPISKGGNMENGNNSDDYVENDPITQALLRDLNKLVGAPI